jgi:glutathione synthase
LQLPHITVPTNWCSNTAGLWGLDDLEDAETAAVLQQAADSPDAFVLKPQREGGGNNLYGEAAREKIAARAGLAAYILMQRIRPPIHRCDTASMDPNVQSF